MKSKKRARTRSKSKVHRTIKTHRRTRAGTTKSVKVETSPVMNTTPRLEVKTCQELEVGDIGGFGSPDELEEHEKRCGEPATEFCNGCGKNFCRAHYDLLHKDHDTSSGQTGNQGLAQL